MILIVLRSYFQLVIHVLGIATLAIVIVLVFYTAQSEIDARLSQHLEGEYTKRGKAYVWNSLDEQLSRRESYNASSNIIETSVIFIPKHPFSVNFVKNG